MTQARPMVACLGAGRMGRGIAVAFAYAGHAVTMIDVKARPAQQFTALEAEALGEVRKTLASLARFGLLANKDADAVVARVSVAPVQTFPTSDGWLFIMCMTDKFWAELVNAIGRTELLSDPRFLTQALRQANRDALTDIIDGELSRKPNAHWLAKLNGVLPIAPVLDLAQALENPFLHSTGMIRNTPHPAKPDMRTLANPIKVNGQRLEQAACSPLGADNAEYLIDQPASRRVVS
ncbi:CoA transferase [Bradyrhizobium sp.]|uniref:CoA transferase n=1 Tax=Bradyrhizobium sp. TaxID=376 RepID=UPI0025C50358|nr:CoA transferase [Bradyrhizobium sp.]